ncbi:MAG: 2-dehydropantoate 2-reductase [Prolixibacteraceae bacterium]|jgi:2-dehydropantoate 2-reductase|nr:2-dehydropantoate 2-reductase [Prolixibacteraceae bacterium]
MKILVIGSGAIGGVSAGILAKKGFDVDIACKNEDIANQLNTDGLIFKVKNRKYIHFIPAYACVKETPGGYDSVLHTTKSFDIEEPTKQVIEKLSETGVIVSFQDGYCEEKLARIAGTDRIVGAVISWAASMNQVGISVMTSGGEMTIGKLDGSDDPRLDNLEFILNSIVPTTVVNNIYEHIYSKLVINSCVTSLGAISGLKLGALVLDKNMRNLFIKLVQEAISIANELKFEIPDFSGIINYYRLVKGTTLYHRIRRHGLIRIIGIKYRKVKSSALQSLERDEKTEIEFMNGYLINKGKELGIDLPVNEQLYKMVTEIEKGERKISQQNLKEVLT